MVVKVTKKIIAFFLGYGTWCLLNWPPDREHLLVGFFAALFVSWIVSDLFLNRIQTLQNPKRYFYFLFQYVPVLILEMIKTNINVAYRIVHPKLPIRPGIVKVRTKLKSDMGLTFLANSITLTPGTMTVDIDRANEVLYVHWLDVKSSEIEQATKMVVDRFEKILIKVFE